MGGVDAVGRVRVRVWWGDSFTTDSSGVLLELEWGEGEDFEVVGGNVEEVASEDVRDLPLLFFFTEKVKAHAVAVEVGVVSETCEEGSLGRSFGWFGPLLGSSSGFGGGVGVDDLGFALPPCVRERIAGSAED